MRRKILLLTIIVLLITVNFNIYQREQLITNGRIILLELAPVDPRSLMQGDYMALRFKIANDAFSRENLEMLKDGALVVNIDERQIATFSHFAGDSGPGANQALLKYRIRNGRSKFATNAFFFQEGHARDYDQARFGEFRVAENGEAILTRMRDKDLLVLGNGKS